MVGEPILVRTIDAHAAGGGVRLVVDGLPPLRGQTLEQKRRQFERSSALWRSGLLREPRGHTDLVGAAFTESVSPGAVAGLLCFTGTRVIPLSGSAIIAAVTIGIERQLLVPQYPEAFVLDTMVGPVHVRATVHGLASSAARRRVERITYTAPPAAVVRAAIPLDVGGRIVRVDIAWASGWFAVVDRESVGAPGERGAADRVRDVAQRVAALLVPRLAEWSVPFPSSQAGAVPALEGIVLTGPASRTDADLRAVTVHPDGTIERSPSGESVAAVVSVLDAMGVIDDSRPVVQEGPAGLCFQARVSRRLPTLSGQEAGVQVEISGTAWITGEHTFCFEADDPLRDGCV